MIRRYRDVADFQQAAFLRETRNGRTAGDYFRNGFSLSARNSPAGHGHGACLRGSNYCGRSSFPAELAGSPAGVGSRPLLVGRGAPA